MATISNTTAVLGGATAAADVACWYINGHPLPVPEDTQLAMGVLIGVCTHAVYLALMYFKSIVDAVVAAKFPAASQATEPEEPKREAPAAGGAQ